MAAVTGTKRTIASGSDFLCFVSTTVAEVETLRPIANQKKCEVSFKPSDREVSSSNAGPWKDYLGGNKEWTGSADVDFSDPGETNANEVDWDELDDYQLARTKFNVVFAFIEPREDYTVEPTIDETRPMYRGSVMVNFPVGGEHGNNMAGSLSFTGCGPLTKVKPA